MQEGAVVDAEAVSTLLFDLGGVIFEIDFDKAFKIWADRASRDPSELRDRFTFDDAYERHERGELDVSDYLEALRRSLGLRLSDEDLVTGWNAIYLDPVPGMAEMLDVASQHFPLYAFTNSNPTHQSVWAKRFARELSVFRSVFVSSELAHRKPDPGAFTVVASRSGYSISEFLFFDDTPENVDGARMAGMQAVLVESSRDVRDALLRLGLDVEA